MPPELVALVFRPRRRGDDPQLLSLSGEAFAPYARRPARTVAGMLIDPEAETEVAAVADLPVGFFVLRRERPDRPFGPYGRPMIATIDAIAVAQPWRRRGVGRRLIDRSEQIARSWGAWAIFLTTASSNRAARGLFTMAGFQEVAIEPRAYASGESGVLMMKPLGP
jgi:ribosomal protein S18 acetylase RimI-like enzyme